MLHNGDIFFDLFRSGRTDENRSYFIVLQNPGKSHLCQGLASLSRQFVEFIDLVQAFRCQG